MSNEKLNHGTSEKMPEWRAKPEVKAELYGVLEATGTRYATLMRQLVGDFLIRQREVQNG